MAKKITTFSIDEKVIKMIKEITGQKVEVQNNSHLIEILVMREYNKMKKEK